MIYRIKKWWRERRRLARIDSLRERIRLLGKCPDCGNKPKWKQTHMHPDAGDYTDCEYCLATVRVAATKLAEVTVERLRKELAEIQK